MANNDLELARSYIKEWLSNLDDVRSWNVKDHENFIEDSDRAKEIIDRILKQDANNQEAMIELARWHLCQSKFEGQYKDGTKKAIKHMEQVIRIAPEVAKYHIALGMLYDKAGKRDLAIKQIDQAVQLDPDNIEYKKELDRVQSESKKGCFIATEVYGSNNAHEVIIFKAFRDDVLLQTKIGHYFTKGYYILSPRLAMFISHSTIFKNFIKKIALDPIAKYLLKNKVI